MPERVRVFLDTSALFAGIWSAEGGGREILRLGEVGALQLLVSPHVLRELEGALRRKAPELLGAATLLLDRVRVEVVASPSAGAVADAGKLTGHLGDARVLAAAREAGVEYFVTLDREHFLNNSTITGAFSFPLGTPGDFLGWFREKLSI